MKFQDDISMPPLPHTHTHTHTHGQAETNMYPTVSTSIYDKRDDFNFDSVNFPFLDGDVLQCPSYGVYISQLIRCQSIFACY